METIATADRFADGITEDIITDLSHSKDLVVIARNSTEVYKGKPVDIRQIGRDLNVKYVLEGSIQSLGERIRLTAQLIEAGSGSHVWSERYDRPADDLFALQNEITQTIAATLAGYEGAVAEAERSLLRRKPPANLSAFDTYLLAMEAKRHEASIPPGSQNDISVRRVAMRKRRPSCLSMERGRPRTPGLRACRQVKGHAQSDSRKVLRPTTRQDIWVTDSGCLVMSALGQKQTYGPPSRASAFPQEWSTLRAPT